MALLRLVEELPSDLLTMSGVDYNSFVLSVSTMKSTIEHEPWISRGYLAPMYDENLGKAISSLRASLKTLPDQQIPAATTGLLFIPDPPLRESIGPILLLQIKHSTEQSGKLQRYWRAPRRKPCCIGPL